MVDDGIGRQPPIYPRRFYTADASPTWFAWNKLSVADVHALREEKGFEGQDIYFWLNHPIQYVRLVGMIVQIELIANDKYAMVILDDGSGASIEIKIQRRKQTDTDASTVVDNLEVPVRFGLPHLSMNGKQLPIGAIVRAEGTVATFRSVRQLVLLRLFVVKDTAEEAAHWAKMAYWKQTVLSKPWMLSQERRDALDSEIRQRQATERERAQAGANMRAKLELKKLAREKRHQKRRQKLEKQLDAGALAGSDVVP